MLYDSLESLVAFFPPFFHRVSRAVRGEFYFYFTGFRGRFGVNSARFIIISPGFKGGIVGK
jgi:hypothetical protein